ncbi:protein kinase [Mucilaginibacter sp. SMC90]|uniref:lanthionine synthetase LanC family protein n=1 Tax=Mucilaginibacter sp. SMC90 TaxID=2929803 RepID=UPI001FB23139|nr:lanthionine synthetase LanC family protein [Mucilaginibacter sp. SMC90]UOE48690.1 protein kinase [Mucilaginibacter sp. SMC90]
MKKQSEMINVVHHDAQLPVTKGYESFFTEHGLAFQSTGHYLMTGQPAPEAGWVFHVPVIRQQMPELAGHLFPLLSALSLAFRIPTSANVHALILEGGLGNHETGKVLSVYPRSGENLPGLAASLINAIGDLKGLAVPGAQRLSDCLYVEYVQHRELTGLSTGLSLEIPEWPFNSIHPYPTVKPRKLIAKSYLIMDYLKRDTKGDVIKCLSLYPFWKINWCVLKEGKRNQCSDDYGRNVRDRLIWQQAAYEQLKSDVTLPAVHQVFEAKGNHYLVMQYVEGMSLHEELKRLYNGRSWKNLEIEVKLQVTGYVLAVGRLLGQFHSRGFLHRDLNPENFQVSAGQIVPLDLELAYDLIQDCPSPAFSLGTPGYMSPSQAASKKPEMADDIYGFGALLLRAFTGLAPTKFNPENRPALREAISALTGSRKLGELISACLNPDGRLRPVLIEVISAVKLYEALLLTGGASDGSAGHSAKPVLRETIGKALASLISPPMADGQGYWLYHPGTGASGVANPVRMLQYDHSLFNGIPGTLLVISNALASGHANAGLVGIFNRNLAHTLDFSNHHDLPAGLAHGGWGLATILVQRIRAGSVFINQDHVTVIRRELSKTSEEVNVESGLAGKALCLLTALEIPQLADLEKDLHQTITAIVNRQQKDGSWVITGPDGKETARPTGFFSGISGIVYTLLRYVNRFDHGITAHAARKGADWLLGQRYTANAIGMWPVKAKSKLTDPWFGIGYAGIAACLIRAWQVFRHPPYRLAAEEILGSYPDGLHSNYLSAASGVAGIGQVMLDAYVVFKDVTWLDKAISIAGNLLNSAFRGTNGHIYWLEGSDSRPAASWMNGSAGVLDFLIRLEQPDRTGFPFKFN